MQAGSVLGAGVMFELDDLESYLKVFQVGGWTLLTAANLMLFSFVHNPCSTTLYTIYKETGSKKWTAVSALLPNRNGIDTLLFGFPYVTNYQLIWRLSFNFK